MKLRKMGNIMLDLEEIITEMIEEHDLQKGEVLALVNAYIDIHFSKSIEEYIDGTSPCFFYGERQRIK